MSWSRRGAAAAIVFSVLALLEAGAEDPWLWVICYLSAAGTGLSLARGNPVAQWACVILVVFPSELALMSLAFEPDELRLLAVTPGEVLTRTAARQALGMLLVAGWAAWLAVARPFDGAALENDQPPSV